MGRAAVARGLEARVEAVVAHDGGDPQAVVAEDAAPPRRLGAAMGRQVAPLPDRLLVAEEGERQELARLAQALEALDRDKSVDALQVGAQGRRQVEVVLGRPSAGQTSKITAIMG